MVGSVYGIYLHISSYSDDSRNSIDNIENYNEISHDQ